MDKSTASPSLAHMAMLYGPRTEQELDAALGPFRRRRDECRCRFQQDGIALTQDEAVEAYKLVAPLYAPDMTDEEAARQAVIHAIAFPCFETGALGFRGPAVKAILEGFERALAEGSQTLHIRHHGEAEAREVDPWSRFVAYEALKHFVHVRQARTEGELEVFSDYRSRIQIIDEPPRALERAQAILAKLTVTRPRGRYDARLTLRRGGYIFTMLKALEGCGLPVTSRDGGSLAGALAETIDVSRSTIAKVWKDWPLRSSQLNAALPPDLRMPESTIRHPREPYAVDVPCAQCGNAGRVPKYRAEGSRLCLVCNPPCGDW